MPMPDIEPNDRLIRAVLGHDETRPDAQSQADAARNEAATRLIARATGGAPNRNREGIEGFIADDTVDQYSFSRREVCILAQALSVIASHAEGKDIPLLFHTDDALGDLGGLPTWKEIGDLERTMLNATADIEGECEAEIEAMAEAEAREEVIEREELRKDYDRTR